MRVCVFVTAGEKEPEDKDVNSEAPSSLSEEPSEKAESNSISQNHTFGSQKTEEHVNSIKKVRYSGLQGTAAVTVNSQPHKKTLLIETWLMVTMCDRLKGLNVTINKN